MLLGQLQMWFQSIVHLMLFMGRIGNIASCVVTIRLLNAKCMHIQLYGLEACPLNLSDYKSLQHRINSVFMKMFATKSNEIIPDCQHAFDCVIDDRIARCKRNF